MTLKRTASISLKRVPLSDRRQSVTSSTKPLCSAASSSEPRSAWSCAHDGGFETPLSYAQTLHKCKAQQRHANAARQGWQLDGMHLRICADAAGLSYKLVPTRLEQVQSHLHATCKLSLPLLSCHNLCFQLVAVLNGRRLWRLGRPQDMQREARPGWHRRTLARSDRHRVPVVCVPGCRTAPRRAPWRRLLCPRPP